MKKIELKEESCITELQIRAHALHTVIEDQENNYFDIGDSSMLAYYFHQAKDRSYMMITLANEMIKLSDELERIVIKRDVEPDMQGVTKRDTPVKKY